MEKYENVDASQNSLDLNIYQVAYLHKLLQGTNFRFQPEDTVKRKVQSLKKSLSRKRAAKSNYTDSAVSNSEMDSMSNRNAETPKVSQQKKPSQPKAAPKPAPKIPEGMRACYERLHFAKQEAKKRSINVDFASLEEGITGGLFSTPQEFESTARQVFNIASKRYEGADAIQKSLNNLLKACIPSEEKKIEQEPPKPVPTPSAPQQQFTTNQNSSMQQQSQSSVPETQAFTGQNLDEPAQLSKDEKKLLGYKIRKLGQKYMRGIIAIVKDEHQQKDNKVEFDINKLSARTNRRLMEYVDKYYEEGPNS